MKKIYSIAIATGMVAMFSGCTTNSEGPAKAEVQKPVEVKKAVEKKAPSINDVNSMTVENSCSIAKHGIDKVFATAKIYNEVAKKEGVEFKRLGTTASQYITLTEEAIKAGSKNVDIYEFKKGKKTKKTYTYSVDFAVWRSCSFAVAALKQKIAGKKTWTKAVPGVEGFVKN
jgi:hypothetical protein